MRHSTLEDVRRALEQTEVFGALPERDLRELIAHGTTTCFGARETIFQKGDPGPSMMVVLAGRVKVSNYSADGKEAVLNFFEPDQVFGEIALLDGKPRTTDATAMVPTELFVLRRPDILPLLASHPQLALRLIEVLCDKLRHTTRMVEDDRLLEPPARIARALLHLADEFGRRCGGAVRLQIQAAPARPRLLRRPLARAHQPPARNLATSRSHPGRRRLHHHPRGSPAQANCAPPNAVVRGRRLSWSVRLAALSAMLCRWRAWR